MISRRLILYAAWFCAMKADLFFSVRGRISIGISVAPLSLFPVQGIHKQQVNALTGNEARGQMRFSIDRNALT
ncbi:MAG: hypothetical protein LBP64_11260, partial [Tannerella sp.]|nr:hypothetical protein [Tannerella sp.]